VLNVSPPAVDFGDVSVGGAKVETVTLSNPANSGPPIIFKKPVAKVPKTKPQEFGFPHHATTCHKKLSPGKNCKIKVIFAPATPGLKTSAMTIFDNAANANQMVPLQGTGK
jgi:hypothetical protein